MEVYLTGNPQITMLKSVYRRHTDFITKREKYDFTNNKIIIPHDENMSVIDKIWISEWKNIKNMRLLIISNNVDIETINLESITESTDDIKIVDIMTQSTLQTFNKIQYSNESKVSENHSNKFVAIPHQFFYKHI